MNIKYYTRLTYDLIKKYNNRKKSGLICFFYDVKENKFTPIPRDIEHSDVASIITEWPKEELRFSERAKQLIPVTFDVDKKGFIKGMVIGICGMEMGYQVKHKKKDLITANDKALKFINNGDIQLHADFNANISVSYRYTE